MTNINWKKTQLFYGKDYFISPGKNVYNESGYENYKDSLSVQELFCQGLLKYLQFNTVLDVGSAFGSAVKVLRNEGKEAFGIEYSAYAVENCWEDVRQYIMQGDCLNLPYPDNSFDLVICEEVLEHLHPHDVSLALAELRRVSNRYIAITIPFIAGIEPKLLIYENLPKDKNGNPLHGHLTLASESWWEEMFINAAIYKDENFTNRIRAFYGYEGRKRLLRLSKPKDMPVDKSVEMESLRFAIERRQRSVESLREADIDYLEYSNAGDVVEAGKNLVRIHAAGETGFLPVFLKYKIRKGGNKLKVKLKSSNIPLPLNNDLLFSMELCSGDNCRPGVPPGIQENFILVFHVKSIDIKEKEQHMEFPFIAEADEICFLRVRSFAPPEMIFEIDVANAITFISENYYLTRFVEISDKTPHQIGSVALTDEGTVMHAQKGQIGFLVYGPYWPLKEGKYRVKFVMQVTGNVNQEIAAIDVNVMDEAAQKEAVEPIRQKVISTGKSEGKEYYIDFTALRNVNNNLLYEFRVFATGKGDVKVKGIILENR